jgi:hypothetical protein
MWIARGHFRAGRDAEIIAMPFAAAKRLDDVTHVSPPGPKAPGDPERRGAVLAGPGWASQRNGAAAYGETQTAPSAQL